ncbi:MAG: AMP-binding protein [Muribaculaceae bacterium]|nr:AMP-binding protein [Muribaculaceae bacterium]
MERSRAELDYHRFVAAWHDNNDFILSHTSGSTGAPKEIRLLKSDMERSARTFITQFGLERRSTVASALPISSVATKMAIVRHIIADCKYVPLPVCNVFDIPGYIDVLSIGPSQTHQFLSNAELRTKVGTLFVGGAPLDSERHRALIDAGYRVCLSYGMTETCSNVALCSDTDGIFIANQDISFTLDGRGCLVIIAPGYSFSGVVTNDVVELIDARRFKWLGRYDNVVNSGGIKLFPEQIEKLLDAYIDRPFYITRRPHSMWGEALAMVIEGSDEDAMRIAHSLRSFSDGVRRPKSIVAVTKFELTATGKIKRVLPKDGLFINIK